MLFDNPAMLHLCLLFSFHHSQKRKSEEIEDTSSPSPVKKSKPSPVKRVAAKKGSAAVKSKVGRPRTAARKKKPAMVDTATSP